jgi:hypothetical protein
MFIGEDMNLLGLNVGSWKVIGERALNYLGRVISLINFVMLINISRMLGTGIKDYIPFAIVCIIGGILFMIFDILVIMPQENTYLFKNNHEIQEMKRDLKELLKRLQVKEGML